VVFQDVLELRAELERKNNLIQKHNERLQNWQVMLNRSPSAPGISLVGSDATASGGAGLPPATVGIPQPGPSQPVASAGAAAAMPGISQGPLAFLELTTSNIGGVPRPS